MALNFFNIFRREPDKKTTRSVETSRSQTPVWIGTTVLFALLFFLSSLLDMKVKVTFGEATGAVRTTGVQTQTVTPANSAPAGGIASQIGGC